MKMRQTITKWPTFGEIAELDAEIEALESRKAKLKQIIKLRSEVAAMESTEMMLTDIQLAIKTISKTVCDRFHIRFEMLMSANRHEDVCVPRQIVFYLCRELKHVPYAVAGRFFGKNHGTIISGCRRTADRIDTDPVFARTVTELAQLCKQKLAET